MPFTGSVMKILARTMVGVGLLVGVVACSDDLQAGIDAYAAGDYRAAAPMIRPLGERGDAEAQYFFGTMYKDGLGLPEDDAQAVEWFRRAAEQGGADSQLTLGAMYSKGEGVPADFVQAYAWASLSADQGDDGGREIRDIVHGYLTPAQLVSARKLAGELSARINNQLRAR
jgi:TPR repeat protein